MWSPLGLVQGITEYGMVDTSPLRKFLTNFFKSHGEEYKRKVAFSAVNAADGNYEIFDESLGLNDKVNAVMSSAAIPFAFPSQHWEFEGSNLVAMDGGSVWNINLASAVQRCQEIVGEDESKITIDILDCGTSK
jgi:predicted acylesterase/phospholipase RssA